MTIAGSSAETQDKKNLLNIEGTSTSNCILDTLASVKENNSSCSYGISQVGSKAKSNEENVLGFSFSDIFPPSATPTKRKRSFPKAYRYSSFVQDVRRLVDSAIFLLNSNNPNQFKFHRNTWIDETTYRNKVLCLAVSSCVHELTSVYRAYQVRLGMFSSSTMVMVPGWKDTIITIGSKGGDFTAAAVVDFDFRKKFVIARCTPAYHRAVRSLPKVFIGTMKELQLQIRRMVNAAQDCLEEQHIALAPWRTAKNMIAMYRHIFEENVEGFTYLRRALDKVNALTWKIVDAGRNPTGRRPTMRIVVEETMEEVIYAQAAELRFMVQSLHRDLRSDIFSYSTEVGEKDSPCEEVLCRFQEECSEDDYFEKVEVSLPTPEDACSELSIALRKLSVEITLQPIRNA